MREFFKKILRSVMTRSLLSARKENKYNILSQKLQKVVPDITEQYTQFSISDNYTAIKVRSQHAFQMDMIKKACARVNKDTLTVVDIGDSSGAHIQYLQGGVVCANKNIEAISVNLDPVAVKKISDKGLAAICCRAEELHLSENYGGKKVDLFLSFETLEHLFDPISFLHNISTLTECAYFVVTVPFLADSKIGMRHIRNGDSCDMYAENTHIFELSPTDWKLLFNFSGWRVVEEKIYYQYPRKGLYRFMQPVWKYIDFEGFYGAVLERDHTIEQQYKSWQ